MATQAKQQTTNRTLPHNLEAEQSVLGCVLIDNDTTIDVFSKLKEEDFYSPAHRIIFVAMKTLYEAGTPVDFVTLVSNLDRGGNLERVGGIGYVTNINEVVPSSANVAHYIEIITKNRVLRKLIGAAGSILENTYTAEDEQVALRAAEKAIFDISKEDERKELTPLGQIMPHVIDRIDTIAKDPRAMRGLPSGFYGLDNLTNGFQGADLVIIAARPSVGKTALSLNMILHAALKHKKRCAVFSLEMSKESLATRALCSVAKVDLGKVMKGDVDSDGWARLLAGNKKLEESNIYVDDNSIITPAEIMRKCQRLKREGGLDLVMIDYLGLMTSGSAKRESRQVEVSDNCRMIKIMAKELDVPVLLLSQLNRGVESRKGADSKPVLSDLRESGAIEQDADIVLFIHRDKTEEGEINDEVELIVAKHRNGPLGNVKLGWKGEWTSFVNLAQA